MIGTDIADHIEKEKAIVSSKLDWTIVRSTKLSNAAPSGRYLAGTDVAATKALGMVPRADFASFLLDEVAGNRFVHQKPAIVM